MFGASLGSDHLDRLIRQLGRMPGIGQKSATRIALHLLNSHSDESAELSRAIIAMREKVRSCDLCSGITEDDLCSICENPRRATGELCIVEQPTDVFSMERAAVFRGRYHVLGGLLSPLDGIEPGDLRFAELKARLETENIQEIVLALSASVEGEATCLYTARVLEGHELRITRLATGIPVGGHLEFVDDVTLERAFSGRRNI
jgi:recombination protein RecR